MPILARHRLRRPHRPVPRATELTKVFEGLRKLWIFARQNYWCCDGCARNAILADQSDLLESGFRGYVFYHQQDGDDWKDTGRLHLGFGVFDDNDPTKLMEEALVVFRSHGFDVEWDGSADQKPEIHA